MATYEFIVPRQSLAEVTERLTPMIAKSDVSERVDPVRYHGEEVAPHVFDLRHYEMQATRGGGRVRIQFAYRLELQPANEGTRVRLRFANKGIKVAGLIFGVLILPLLVISLLLAHVPAAKLPMAIGVMLGIVAVLFGFFSYIFYIANEHHAEREYEFLRARLGANL
jgi:hypothetical protein